MTDPSGLVATAISTSAIDLSWTNGIGYNSVSIERSPAGGASWTEIANLGASTFSDSTCSDGTAYDYRVRGYNLTTGLYTDYSGTATAITLLPVPTGFDPSCISATEVEVKWVDGAANESGFKVYRDGNLVHTSAANALEWHDTGLTAATWYKYEVECYNAIQSSGKSAAVWIFTSDPPNAPSLLTATAKSQTKIQLNWQDNSSNETGFKIERSADGTTYAEIGTVGANIQTYESASLSSNTRYWYRVRSNNISGNSAYSNAADATTWAAVAQPTSPAVTPWGSGTLEITFVDNSEEEDGHSIERSDNGSTGWAEIVELPPNHTFYRDTALGAGTTKFYRVRGRQDAIYSAYSDIVSGTTFAVPAAPTALVISEYQDTWVRLTWTKTTGETGYRIEKSVDNGANYTEVAQIIEGAEYHKVTGLTASTHYHFRVCAFNPAGDSTFATAVSQTTRAAYLPSKFEKFCRRPKARAVYLVEINPSMDLSGWTLKTAATYTYQYTVEDSLVADFDAITENGVRLAEQVNVANVETTVGSWYYDAANHILYVRTAGGGDPVNYTIIGSFWLYFTTWQRGATVYNGIPYLPFIPGDGIPDVTQEVLPYYKGSFAMTHGTLSLINGKLNKQFLWDKRYTRYNWKNRKVRVLAGGEGFAYSEFAVVSTAVITSIGLTDARLSLALGDYRQGIHRTLPTDRFSTDIFPLLSSNAADRGRPYYWGAIVGAIPVCIDTTNRVFELMSGRIKSVEYVYKNGTALTAGTDYYVDYQRGRITLAAALAFTTSDKLTADFTGAVDGNDAAIKTGALVYLDLLLDFLALDLSDIDLDSIYETNATATANLCVPVYKDRSSEELIERIEKSCIAYSFQDSQGRLGLRLAQTVAPSDIKYVINQRIFDFEVSAPFDNVFSEIYVNYSEDPSDEGRLSWIRKAVNETAWRSGIQNRLDINSALTTAADAEALGTAIIATLGKDSLTFTLDRVLYTAQAGDLIYLSRDRFYSLSGTANNRLLRILSIAKNFSSGRTSIRAEAVA